MDVRGEAKFRRELTPRRFLFFFFFRHIPSLCFGHFNFKRKRKQTAVTNITKHTKRQVNTFFTVFSFFRPCVVYL